MANENNNYDEPFRVTQSRRRPQNPTPGVNDNFSFTDFDHGSEVEAAPQLFDDTPLQSSSGSGQNLLAGLDLSRGSVSSEQEYMSFEEFTGGRIRKDNRPPASVRLSPDTVRGYAAGERHDEPLQSPSFQSVNNFDSASRETKAVSQSEPRQRKYTPKSQLKEQKQAQKQSRKKAKRNRTGNSVPVSLITSPQDEQPVQDEQPLRVTEVKTEDPKSQQRKRETKGAKRETIEEKPTFTTPQETVSAVIEKSQGQGKNERRRSSDRKHRTEIQKDGRQEIKAAKKIKKDNEKLERRMNDGVGNKDQRRRLIQRSRRKNERNLIVIIASGIISAVFIAAFCIYFFGIAVVRNFELVNTSVATYTDEKLELSSGIVRNKSRMLFVFESSVNNVMTKENPYLAEVTIEKEWPNSIKLTVSETADRFCLSDGEKYLWIDSDGKALDETKRKVGSGKISVSGISLEGQNYEIGEILVPNSENKAKFETLLRLGKAIEETGIAVKSVKFNSDSELTMAVGKYLTIRAKKDNDFEKKLAGVVELMKQIGDVTTESYFDISEPNTIKYNGTKLVEV